MPQRPGPDDGLAIIPLKPLPAGNSSLRFAEEPEDEWTDEDVYEEPGLVSVAWVWTKRLIVIGVLGAGGFVAARTWETWLPKAGQFGVAVASEIHKHVQPQAAAAPNGEETERQVLEQAVAAAAAEMPHLDPDTIEQVMASSATGVLDPAEVFRRAYDATARGTSTLRSDEVEELRTLQRAVAAAVRPSERERMREYDGVRTVRITLPFEDREMLGIYARGVGALPPRSRERLQALAGKAVVAGLAAGAPAAQARS